MTWSPVRLSGVSPSLPFGPEVAPGSVGAVLLHEIVDVSARMAATRSRKEKTR